jgi:single-strand DNA-binding protein
MDANAYEYEYCNEVVIVGRVTSEGVERELPSGDKVVEFRVVVERAPAKKSRTGKREVDSLDIASWSATTRRSSLSVKKDDWVEVNGSIRRRFWQGAKGLGSRWQIEAHQITRL